MNETSVRDICLKFKGEKNFLNGKRTILFVDEVHRFNKSQQDAFLPFVEDGTIIFVGATTENPSFELNNALLSRCRVYTLKSLSDSDIETVISRALKIPVRGLSEKNLQFTETSLAILISAADGDARRALNLLEIAGDLAAETDGGVVETDQSEVAAVDTEIIDEDELLEETTKEVSAYDRPGKWFVVHTQSGYEKKVKQNPPVAVWPEAVLVMGPK